MTKEFIPYEQALELKRLGFDEPCLDGYGIHGALWMKRLSKQSEVDGACLAPLYQQAFRFFRERYKLNHLIDFDYDHYNAVVGVSCVKSCETYEEAELECLKQLIKIVKHKK